MKLVSDQRVVIRGYLTSWTGYGQIAEWLGRGLERLGIPVVFWPQHVDEKFFPLQPWVKERLFKGPVPPDKWVLSLNTPMCVAVPGKRSVAFTMWEVTGLMPQAIHGLNHAERVVVPCAFNKKYFGANGVATPIDVVPLGIDVSEGYSYEAPREYDGRPFMFGTAGRVSHGGERKGLEEAIEAFRLAFPDKSDRRVALSVKVWEDCKIKECPDPRVKIDRRPLIPPAMAEWYKDIDVYVTASKGEGWGLQTHQAMAVGRPVIAAKWSGTAEFFDERFGWEVPYTFGPAGRAFYFGLGQWALPDLPAMAAAMQEAYANRDVTKAKGRAAATRAAEFTWDRTARELLAVLVECGMLQVEGATGERATKTERTEVAVNQSEVA